MLLPTCWEDSKYIAKCCQIELIFILGRLIILEGFWRGRERPRLAASRLPRPPQRPSRGDAEASRRSLPPAATGHSDQGFFQNYFLCISPWKWTLKIHAISRFIFSATPKRMHIKIIFVVVGFISQWNEGRGINRAFSFCFPRKSVLKVCNVITLGHSACKKCNDTLDHL